MARILLHWRIVSAGLFSVVLIGSAVFIARDAQSPRSAQASAESDLLKAIATKDSDGDGLPDWEESLYGADPNRVDSFGLNMPDGQAVAKGLVVPRAVAEYEVQTSSAAAKTPGIDDSIPPPPTEGTLTAVFAQTLYVEYRVTREAKGADLSSAEIAAVTQKALRTFASSIKPSGDFKTSKDISTAGSGEEALRAYAIAVDAIFQKNTDSTTKSELTYLQEVVQENKEDSLASIVAIAKAYRETAIGLSKLPVPTELSNEGLRLMNSLMRIAEVTTNFAQVRVDPLATMLALEQYPQATLDLAHALIGISNVYKKANITFAEGDSGAGLVNIISDLAKEQEAPTQP